MAASSPVDRVRAIATAVAEAAGLVLEDVTLTPAGRRRVLRAVVDLPEGGVSMDAVAVVSQALSEALDREGVMGERPYVLEVTSPGVDRPLTARRHFARCRGRLVRVVLADGTSTTGRVAGAGESGLELADGRVLGWPTVVRGRVEVEFSHPQDGGPDTTGADPDTVDEESLDEESLDEDLMDDEQDDGREV